MAQALRRSSRHRALQQEPTARELAEKTTDDIEAAVLDLRDQHHWGARKIRAVLRKRGLDVPSIRTVHAILERRGRVAQAPTPPEPTTGIVARGPREKS